MANLTNFTGISKGSLLVKVDKLSPSKKGDKTFSILKISSFKALESWHILSTISFSTFINIRSSSSIILLAKTLPPGQAIIPIDFF